MNTVENISAVRETVHNLVRPATSDGIAVDRLKSIVDRIENLEEQKKNLSEDIKDLYTESKSAGFDPKVLRTLIATRRKDQDEVEEHETMLDVYRRALGMTIEH